ncbi:Uncharacterised protein [Rhodococcus gordoniae]|uniref:Uncharacterized protein n=1 Tax=Rhodococcus gordoniae TaxID=223392 RepID=A0A379M0G7_9NOCA|nr:hypothetical protein [Rhodococcus gordoniae]SUE14905.1 Uncharacterised protein [Rhodococcus gordoniae]
MDIRQGTIGFDGDAVRAVAARLAEVAEDADREIRRGFGGLRFDGSGTGSAHRSAGVCAETGYRRVRASCETWVATVQAHADALRAVADGYLDQDLTIEVALADVAARAALDHSGDRRS